MPNWVYNTVSLEGEANAKKVFDFMRTDDNDFDYNQLTQDWGVKWNAGDTEVYGEGVTFNSPWGHPDNVIYELSRKFPDIEFHVYWEEEQGFGAEYDILDGDKFDENTWDMPEYHSYTGSDGYEITVKEYKDDRNDEKAGFYREDSDEQFDSFECATRGYDRREKLKNYKGGN
jgi:hypothetical protein